MNIQEVITLARASELKQLSIGTDDASVMGYINLGILELHKRFALLESEAIVQLVEGKYKYKLDGTDTNVQLGSDEGEEILFIGTVYDIDGNEIRVNDEEYDYSITTPSFDTIEVSNRLINESKFLSVIYRSTPRFISKVEDKLRLPMTLLEPLLHYIGYRAHASVKGDMQTENNTHYQRFDKSCNMVVNMGLITSDGLGTGRRLRERGFV